MTILLLNWEGEDVGELLAIPVHISLANLHLNLTTINININTKM